MEPEGIVDCRVCGKPTRGFGGGTCEDCDAVEYTAEEEAHIRDLEEIAAQIDASSPIHPVVAASVRLFDCLCEFEEMEQATGTGYCNEYREAWSDAVADYKYEKDQALADEKAQERRWRVE